MKFMNFIVGPKKIWSAGGVILKRINSEDTEVILCHRVRQNLWALPKGSPNNKEGIKETALREVREETGLEVEITGLVDTIRYSFKRIKNNKQDVDSTSFNVFDKLVHFYLMNAIDGRLDCHDDEFDEVKWVNVRKALGKLTYENETRVLEKALALFDGTGN